MHPLSYKHLVNLFSSREAPSTREFLSSRELPSSRNPLHPAIHPAPCIPHFVKTLTPLPREPTPLPRSPKRSIILAPHQYSVYRSTKPHVLILPDKTIVRPKRHAEKNLLLTKVGNRCLEGTVFMPHGRNRRSREKEALHPAHIQREVQMLCSTVTFFWWVLKETRICAGGRITGHGRRRGCYVVCVMCAGGGVLRRGGWVALPRDWRVGTSAEEGLRVLVLLDGARRRTPLAVVPLPTGGSSCRLMDIIHALFQRVADL